VKDQNEPKYGWVWAFLSIKWVFMPYHCVTDIAGNTDSRYGAICGQKRSAEISILAQILLSKIRFVPFSYIRISGWFCHNVDIAARFEGEFLRS
jgi:hypothetical protein